MNIIRIVYERGIEICRAESGKWLIQSVPGANLEASHAEIVKDYGVRPILATQRRDYGGDVMLLLPSTCGGIVDARISQLFEIALGKHVRPMRALNLSYLLGALRYHCKSLAERYSEICRNFAQHRAFEKRDSDNVILGMQEEPYYEFEALLTAALRTYDATRYIIWPTFGLGGSTPSSFEKALPLCKDLPEKLKQQLNSSWARFGDKLKHYRDCIQHYIPIGSSRFCALMTRLKSGVWSTSIWIPDNPEVRSYEQFRYDCELDALSYGWELTNEMVDVVHSIVNAIPDKAQNIKSP